MHEQLDIQSPLENVDVVALLLNFSVQHSGESRQKSSMPASLLYHLAP